MAVIDPNTIRMTTLCVYSLCLGYRRPITASSNSGAGGEVETGSDSLIVVSAALLILFFVAVVVLVLWELTRRTQGGWPDEFEGEYEIGSGRQSTARGCGASRAGGENVLSLYEHFDCVSPLEVVGDDADGGPAQAPRDRLCAICLEEVGTQEVTRRLPCKHRFHARCLDRWFLQEAMRPLAEAAVDAPGRQGSKKGAPSCGVRCPLCAAVVKL